MLKCYIDNFLQKQTTDKFQFVKTKKGESP